MRNTPLSLLLSTLVLAVSACSNGTAGEAADKTGTAKMTADSAGKAPAYTVAMVDNKKDPSCGMPVTAGIGDTVHYQGKVIGFCSKECRDDFMKDPVAGLKKTEFKK